MAKKHRNHNKKAVPTDDKVTNSSSDSSDSSNGHVLDISEHYLQSTATIQISY